MARCAVEVSGPGFGGSVRAARLKSGLSVSQLAKASRLGKRRVTALERGDDVPTDSELGVLAQACGVSVFDLVPAGQNLRVLLHDQGAGTSEANGEVALDALLREYLSMVVELRRGNPVTAPSLRHDDLAVLAANLGGTPDAIEARLVELLGSEAVDPRALRALILPSTAT
jgi:transcriptional regulator with XRE-family HTH domain